MENQPVRRRGMLQDEDYQQPENIAGAFDVEVEAKESTIKNRLKQLKKREPNDESKPMRISGFAIEVLEDVQHTYRLQSKKEALDHVMEFYYKKTRRLRDNDGYLDKGKIEES